MMAFPSIDAVRNLRSNRVRTARLTPPQGYGDAWRRLVQRNAAQRVQQCVSQRGRWCAVAGHSRRRRPAWCTHTALPQQRRQQRWRKWCSPAVLRSAAAAQCPAFVANICRGGVSPRRRGSASARSCCLDHVPARQQVAPCRRCRRPARRARLASRARQALGSHGKDATSAIDSPEPPTVRKGRGRGPRHPSMQWHGAEMSVSDRPSVATSLVRRVSGGVAVFCCAID